MQTMLTKMQTDGNYREYYYKTYFNFTNDNLED